MNPSAKQQNLQKYMRIKQAFCFRDYLDTLQILMQKKFYRNLYRNSILRRRWWPSQVSKFPQWRDVKETGRNIQRKGNSRKKKKTQILIIRDVEQNPKKLRFSKSRNPKNHEIEKMPHDLEETGEMDFLLGCHFPQWEIRRIIHENRKKKKNPKNYWL